MAERCRICGENTATEHGGVSAGALVMEQACPKCGRWKALLDTVVPDFGAPANAALMPFLAAHIRQANAAGEMVVELTAHTWRRFAEAHAHTPIPRRLDLLLRWYESKSPHAGAQVPLEGNLYPLIDAKNQNEVGFLNETLVEQGLLAPRGAAGQFCVTAKGWERLYPSAPGGIPGTCFVAMSFAPELNPAFDEGIKPAVEDDCGFRVLRVDRVEHNENINDLIMADLRAAEIVVADFTDHRPGVYFEAGFALGLGRPVVWTCRADQLHEAHFDTRPYNHVRWTTPAELRERLTRRIRATVPSTPRRA